MIAWLNPAALWGLAILAGPVIVHLLQRDRAERIRFPSLRFIQPSRLAAVHLRLPADLLLLAVRLGICALAVAAMARPLLITSSRLSVWNQRTARAVVVDVSDSMRAASSNGSNTAAVIAAEARGADSFLRIDDARLSDGLTRAVAQLSSAPPARREIVIFSDFQQGALAPQDLAMVPASIGLRLVTVGTLPPERLFDASPLLGAETTAVHQVRLAKGTTATTITPGPAATTGIRLTGADVPAGLLRIVAAAGAPAPSDQQPLAIVFAGGSLPRDARAIANGWMLHTVLRLRGDADVADAARESAAAAARDADATWFVLFRDAQQRPLVRAAAAGSELVIDVAAGGSSYLSAAVVRGVLTARTGPPAYAEQEIERLAPRTLAGLDRAAGPVEEQVWRQSDVSDARWCWAAVLALLAVEAVVRRTQATRPEARAHAA